MTSLEDIFVWADGTWMFREDYCKSIWLSDDYYVIKVDSKEYEGFLEGRYDI